MRLIFILEYAEHDKSAGLNIKKEAKKNQVSEDVVINNIQDQFWEFAQSWELGCYLDDVQIKIKEVKENK